MGRSDDEDPRRRWLERKAEDAELAAEEQEQIPKAERFAEGFAEIVDAREDRAAQARAYAETASSPAPPAAPAVPAPVPVPEPAPLVAPVPDADEDLRNAVRLVQRARGTFLAVHGPGGVTWRRWDGRRWSADATGALFELAARVARSFLADAANLSGDSQKKLMRHAVRSQRSDRIQAAVWLAARALPDLKATPETFDLDPWLLNVENGVLDLRTGELRDRDPSDLITRLAPVRFDPDAQASRFERFLEEVLPNPAVRAYVQRCAGYSLTAHIREHCLFLLTGGGRNGKGVLMRALLAVFGEYAVTAAGDLLILRHNDGHPTELAALDGARFVYASEVPPGRHWNEARLKQLTGGDPVSARRMREDFYTIRMQGKFWVAVNDRPHVRSASNAIWSRIKEIRFPVEFREADDPDPARQHLPVKDERLDEALAEERPGILAWAVRGCLEWQRRGLGEPPEVREAVAAYRQAEDRLGAFLAEHPVVEKIRLKEFFQKWSAYCAETNETAGKQGELADALRTRGYDVRLSTGKVFWVLPRDEGSRGVTTAESRVIGPTRARDSSQQEKAPPYSPTPLEPRPAQGTASPGGTAWLDFTGIDLPTLEEILNEGRP